MAVEISANTAKFNSALSDTNKKLDKFGSNIKTIGAGLLAGFGLMEIGRGVIDVTSQFQKFEATLTNTLGSNSMAKAALDQISDFAVRTPFELAEVTAAYVRWTNQGLTPTISKLQMIGDVASSLGAGYEQTAEAFKDLAVGQTKRIEEIGISAEQANGKIKLSFKGVTIEVEKNAAGVQQALETYSQLQGVLGATAAQTGTLGARTSELKDRYDQLLRAIGESQGGPINWIIDKLINMTIIFGNLGAEAEIFGRKILGIIPIVGDEFLKLENVSAKTLDYLTKYGQVNSGRKVADVVAEVEAGRTTNQLLEQKIELQKQFQTAFSKEGETAEDIQVIWDRYLIGLNKRYQTEKEQETLNRVKEQQAKTARENEEKRVKLAEQQAANEKAAAEAAEKALKAKQKDAELTAEINRLYGEQFKLIDELIRKRAVATPETMGVSYTTPQTALMEAAANAQQGPSDPFGLKGIQEQIRSYAGVLTEGTNANLKFTESIAQINGAFGDAASQGLQSFFTGLGAVAAKQVSFGDNILKAIATFMKQFGENLIALGIAKLGLDNLFKTGLGGPAAIAAGVALVAAAGAVSRQLANKNKQLGGGGSGGGGGSFSGQTITATGAQQSINISGKLMGSGRDLVAVINQTSFDNSQRKGG